MSEAESRLEFLKQFLAERDTPCPLCEYNLRGLTSDMCPECGSEVQVTVGLTEPRMGAYIAGVVGLAAGLGFDMLMLLWVSVMLIQGRGGPRMSYILPLPLGAAVLGVSLWVWLKRRRAIRQMDAGKRRKLVAGCYVLSVGLAVLFFARVR